MNKEGLLFIGLDIPTEIERTFKKAIAQVEEDTGEKAPEEYMLGIKSVMKYLKDMFPALEEPEGEITKPCVVVHCPNTEITEFTYEELMEKFSDRIMTFTSETN